MNLGTENKKKTLWAAVLGVVALALVAFELIPFFTGGSTTTAAGNLPTLPAAQGGSTLSVRPPRVTGKRGSGPKNSQINALDPTVRLDLLEAAGNHHYQGSGRNIFEAYVAPPPAPKQAKLPPPPPLMPQAQQPPPPPPINLKFYGWASKPGEPRRVFLSQGDEIFIAGEGQLVANRYKVVRITDTSVQIEDILNNNTQLVPIT